MRRFLFSTLFALAVFSIAGCTGADNEVRESGVDDSVVHTEEEMADMEASNAADMRSE